MTRSEEWQLLCSGARELNLPLAPTEGETLLKSWMNWRPAMRNSISRRSATGRACCASICSIP